MNARDARSLIEKLSRLTPQRQAEVEDFVDFLRSREQASEPAFTAVWDNEVDAEYDRL